MNLCKYFIVLGIIFPGISWGQQTDLYDVNGYFWDINHSHGYVVDGTSDAYDVYGYLCVTDLATSEVDCSNDYYNSTGSITYENGGRQLVFPVNTINSLEVTRKIYVPNYGSLAYARFLESFHNPTAAAIDAKVIIYGNLGSDSYTIVTATSSGTALGSGTTWFNTDDSWDGGDDPSLGHILANSSGAVQVNDIISSSSDQFYFSYIINVPAGGTINILHYETQNPDRASGHALSMLITDIEANPQLLEGLNGDEISSIVNFGFNLTCGNGVVDSGEFCDDGNLVNGDGCSSDCLSDEICGNGIVDKQIGEVCDDGNNINGDGCNADCLGQCGYSTTADMGVLSPVDGACFLIFDATPITNLEARAECTALGGHLATVADATENGVLTQAIKNLSSSSFHIGLTDEMVEDSFGWLDGDPSTYRNWNAGEPNNVGDEDCVELISTGFWNDIQCDLHQRSYICEINTVCGNNILELDEVCDDGNNIDGDGCSADCLSDESCGNGIVDSSGGEICDDGNTEDGDGCSADCLSDESCGNGILDSAVGEACDDGNNIDGDGCQANCALPECGDGILDPEEVCDDGNTEDGDGCNSMCTSDESCGNGIIDVDEVCDDGNTEDGDGCSSDCLSNEICGNGILDLEEVCDDGNTEAGDGCSADCLSDESCGNGILDLDEECDDGNTEAGDGCDSSCFIEVECGNGTVEGNEVCDDGNNVDGDGCSADCLSDESCGNGIVDLDEECDDGNNLDDDGCDSNCFVEGDSSSSDSGCSCQTHSQKPAGSVFFLAFIIMGTALLLRRKF